MFDQNKKNISMAFTFGGVPNTQRTVQTNKFVEVKPSKTVGLAGSSRIQPSMMMISQRQTGFSMPQSGSTLNHMTLVSQGGNRYMPSMVAAKPPQMIAQNISSVGFRGGSSLQNHAMFPSMNGRPLARSSTIAMQASSSGDEYINPVKASFLNDIPMAPPDGILKLSAMFKEDQDPRKVNLGIGAYRDDEGNPFVFQCVKDAETLLAKQTAEGKLYKEYSAIDGTPEFQEEARKVLFGDNHMDTYNGLVASAQTLSGTGALRILAEYLKKYYDQPIYISNPTWGNHKNIFNTCGLETREYKYFDAETKGLDFDGMIADLKAAPKGAIILLHTCAHNPTGVDPTLEQWKQIGDVMAEREQMPFFDTAYQGFVTGDLDKDGEGLRHFLNRGFNMVVAQSFAKIMGLYGERCGALHIVTSNPDQAANSASQIKALIRQNYSSPPIHGQRLAETVLRTPELKEKWLADLQQVTSRITSMRALLKKNLEEKGAPGNWDHITKQIGMFSFTGLSKEQSERMISKHHVYMTGDGRISIAGITEKNVGYIAEAIKECVENA